MLRLDHSEETEMEGTGGKPHQVSQEPLGALQRGQNPGKETAA